MYRHIKKTIGGKIILVLVILATSGYCAETSIDKLMDDVLAPDSTSSGDSSRSLNNVLRAREKALIDCGKALISMHKRDTLDETRLVAVIRSLGEIGGEQGAEFLVANISYSPKLNISRWPRPGDIYPCMGALRRIGIPSMAPIRELLKKSDDELAIKVAREALREICFDICRNNEAAHDLAGSYLEIALSETKDNKERERLEASIEFLKNLDDEDLHRLWFPGM